jgi:hypothetical protein
MYTVSGSSRTPVGATTTYTTSDPVTGSIAIGIGDTLVVALILNSGGTPRTGGAPTFGTYTMSQADTSRAGLTSPEITCEMWYITASGINQPTITDTDISLPNTNGGRTVIDLVSAKTAPGKTSILQVATGSAVATTSTNPYCKITPTAGSNIIFEVVADGANTWNPTARTAIFTNINDNDIGNYGGGMQYAITNSTSIITGSWTFGTAEDWGVVMAAFGETNAPIYTKDVTQAQTSDNVTLTVYNPILLTVQDAQQLQTSDNTTLDYHPETPPTTVLGTPAEGYQTAASSLELKFTGTDSAGHRLDYEVQVDITPTFSSGSPQLDQVATTIEYGSGTGYTITFPNRPAVGSLVVVGISQWESGIALIDRVDDNQGNTYYEAVQKLDGTNNVSSSIFYAKNVASSGTFTITITPTVTGKDTAIGAVSYIGVDKVSPLSGIPNSGTGVGTTASSGSTIAEGTGVYIGVLGYNLASSGSETAPWEKRFEITGALYSPILGVDLITSGSQEAIFTLSSANWVATIAAFKSGSPLIDAFSTDHTGFSAGASHPTDSGIEQTYTTQTPLSADTYYWRVRATDNTTDGTYSGWGGWSGSKSFIITGAEGLTIQSSAQLQKSDNVSLTQHQILAISDAQQAQTADNVVLKQNYTLTVTGAQQVQTADKVPLTAHYSITVNGSQQAQTSDNIPLTQHQVLIINGAQQTQTSGKVDLASHYAIMANGAYQAQTTENIVLSQHYLLGVGDATQAQTSNSISLSGGIVIKMMHYIRLRSK